MPQRLMNVSVIRDSSPYRSGERQGGSQRRQKTTQVGQSTAKKSQVIENQKGGGDKTTKLYCIERFSDQKKDIFQNN